ncbi:hypothetical protein NHJ13734_005022 [Beauveria thailandica]
MLRSFWGLFGGRNSDPPPEYQTVDPLNRQNEEEAPQTEQGVYVLFEPDDASPTEQDDTPRNRFDYHVKLRGWQQLEEWGMRGISRELYGQLDSQVEVARDWVIHHWKSHGLWAATWHGTGPSRDDQWPCGDSEGMPTSLLSLELEWEMEHLVEIQRPTLIPHLFGSEYQSPTCRVPLQWGFDHFVRTALYNVTRRWRRAGFRCSGVEQPGVRFCRDLKLLYASLPVPARQKLDSLDVHCWADLLCGETRPHQGPRFTIFGRIIEDAQANAMPSPAAGGLELEAPRTDMFGRIIGDARAYSMPSPTTDGSVLQAPRSTIFGQVIRDAQANSMPSLSADSSVLDQPRTGIFGRLNGDAQVTTMPSPTADGSMLEQPRTGIFGRSNGDAQVTTILSPTADGLELEPTRTDISGRITRDAQANATPSPTADGLELEEISQVVQTRRTTRRGGRVPRRPPRRRGVVKRRRGVAERRRRGL